MHSFIRLLYLFGISETMDDSNIISNAVASLEMENLHPSAFDREIAVKLIRGEIGINTAIDTLINRYRVES